MDPNFLHVDVHEGVDLSAPTTDRTEQESHKTCPRFDRSFGCVQRYPIHVLDPAMHASGCCMECHQPRNGSMLHARPNPAHRNFPSQYISPTSLPLYLSHIANRSGFSNIPPLRHPALRFPHPHHPRRAHHSPAKPPPVLPNRVGFNDSDMLPSTHSTKLADRPRRSNLDRRGQFHVANRGGNSRNYCRLSSHPVTALEPTS